ncbi:MAG: hypothetical protein II815_05150 [Bacteroidales bacterium]|nr:hypothetical protein [Bacteroidales bacterium]
MVKTSEILQKEKQYTLEIKKLQADVAFSIAVLGDSNLVTHPQGDGCKSTTKLCKCKQK